MDLVGQVPGQESLTAMLSYIFKRIGLMIPTLLGALTVIQGAEMERRLESLEVETGVKRGEQWP